MLDRQMKQWNLGVFQNCFPSQAAHTEFLSREIGMAEQTGYWAFEFLRVCGNILRRERKGFSLVTCHDCHLFILPTRVMTFLTRRSTLPRVILKEMKLG